MNTPDPARLRADIVALVRKHRFTRDLPAEDREDLAHAVIESVLNAQASGEDVRNLDAYVETLVRNRGIDRLRGKAKRADREQELPTFSDDGIDDFFREWRDDRLASLRPVRERLLAQIFALIPAEDADLLRSRFLDGESAKNVADRLGISPAAVDQRAHRAKAALKVALERREDLLAELRAPHPHVY